jgi:hypothetical protein
MAPCSERAGVHIPLNVFLLYIGASPTPLPKRKINNATRLDETRKVYILRFYFQLYLHRFIPRLSPAFS